MNYRFMVPLGNFLVWGAVSSTQIRKLGVNAGPLPIRQDLGEGRVQLMPPSLNCPGSGLRITSPGLAGGGGGGEGTSCRRVDRFSSEKEGTYPVSMF